METKKSFLKNMYSKIFIMIGLLVIAFFFSMCIGRYSITPLEVVEIIVSHITGSGGEIDPIRFNVVMQVRLPRILLSIIIGAGLACSGAAYQCLFGNPLVSPDILGVSAGAGFGAALAILFFSQCLCHPGAGIVIRNCSSGNGIVYIQSAEENRAFYAGIVRCYCQCLV
jgi:ABC-type Fe3+-siderophore transport system permease subunit